MIYIIFEAVLLVATVASARPLHCVQCAAGASSSLRDARDLQALMAQDLRTFDWF